MKHFRMLTALLLTVGCSLLVLTACGSSDADSAPVPPAADTEAMEPQTLRPVDLGVQAQPGFDLPVMGLSITLPQALQEAIANQTVFMDAYEEATSDNAAISYAYVSWNSVTEEQRAAEIPFDQTALRDWLSGLTRMGSIGVFAADRVDELDALTLSTDHELLGKSADGAYHYYLSTNAGADEAHRALLDGIGHSLYPMGEYGGSAFGPVKPDPVNLGQFTMTDINGETYTEAMFAENTLTMVNLFATWCSPCVREIPDLAELHTAMADKGVTVIGVVLDGVDRSGAVDETAIAKAQKLAEKTGASYPFLIPDKSMMNGRLLGVTAVPETFFVDSQGNIVGDAYPGARSLKDWTAIVEHELSRLQEVQG